MTAEVAIVNANAVAIAADSAVTIGLGRKICNSAIKVFALSKVAPVGVMVYGNAGLLGVPWETVIKIYRGCLQARTFDVLEDYANDFLQFLSKERRFFPQDLQDSWVEGNVRGYFDVIRRELISDAEKTIEDDGKIDEQTTLRIFQDCINEHHERLKGTSLVKGMTAADESAFRKQYNALVKTIITDIFPSMTNVGGVLAKLYDIAAYLHTRELFSDSVSGVVICGFGSKDIYPAISTHEIEGILGKKLKYRHLSDKSVRMKNGADCSIVPFAQGDMVALFMEGINPAVNTFISWYLGQLFARLPELVSDADLAGDDQRKEKTRAQLRDDAAKLLDEFMDEFREHKGREHVVPILKMVQVLPKDELAAMAEALVNLTAFKRRMTDELETVGGPIDVAVISKGDGLVWVKRKHYFPPDLNQHFFGSYFREFSNGSQ